MNYVQEPTHADVNVERKQQPQVPAKIIRHIGGTEQNVNDEISFTDSTYAGRDRGVDSIAVESAAAVEDKIVDRVAPYIESKPSEEINYPVSPVAEGQDLASGALKYY